MRQALNLMKFSLDSLIFRIDFLGCGIHYHSDWDTLMIPNINDRTKNIIITLQNILIDC